MTLEEIKIFVARCHGETEEHRLPRAFFMSAKDVQKGKAFVIKKIDDQKRIDS